MKIKDQYPTKLKASLRTKTLLLAVVGTAFLALTGCVSTRESNGKGKQALVCPQCKMVEVVVRDLRYPGVSRYGGYGSGTNTYYDHTCPGCQGAITTFLKEGKLKHKCSICKESPFTCPVFHPTKN